MMRLRRMLREQQGVTVMELLVAIAVFALFILMLDAVFVAANRSARKAELAADVQQNARIAIERLTREIRESNPAQIRVGGSAGTMAVVFKSARLPAENTVFCLYVRNTTDPTYVYNADCFTFPGGNLTPPPYGTPPASPLGTYTPIWQRYIGYFVVPNSGVYELRRVTAQLDTAGAALPDPTTLSLSGGDVVATFVETFDVALSSSNFTATLKAKGTQVVQGTSVPAQEVLLPGQALVRN